MDRIDEASPRARARFAGAVYLLTYLEVLGFLAEASLMLWLLVFGVNDKSWLDRTGVYGRGVGHA